MFDNDLEFTALLLHTKRNENDCETKSYVIFGICGLNYMMIDRSSSLDLVVRIVDEWYQYGSSEA